MIVGVDPSLTSTGIAHGKTGDQPALMLVKTKPPKTKDLSEYAVDHERMSLIAGTIADLEPDLLVIEGTVIMPSTSKTMKFAGNDRLAKLRGYIASAVPPNEVPTVEVPPGTLKNWATGNGSADKEQMIAEAVKMGAEIPDKPLGGRDDLADAYHLWTIGLMMARPSPSLFLHSGLYERREQAWAALSRPLAE